MPLSADAKKYRERAIQLKHKVDDQRRVLKKTNEAYLKVTKIYTEAVEELLRLRTRVEDLQKLVAAQDGHIKTLNTLALKKT